VPKSNVLEPRRGQWPAEELSRVHAALPSAVLYLPATHAAHNTNKRRRVRLQANQRRETQGRLAHRCRQRRPDLKGEQTNTHRRVESLPTSLETRGAAAQKEMEQQNAGTAVSPHHEQRESVCVATGRHNRKSRTDIKRSGSCTSEAGSGRAQRNAVSAGGHGCGASLFSNETSEKKLVSPAQDILDVRTAQARIRTDDESRVSATHRAPTTTGLNEHKRGSQQSRGRALVARLAPAERV
jgi:hypothetical protein